MQVSMVHGYKSIYLYAGSLAATQQTVRSSSAGITSCNKELLNIYINSFYSVLLFSQLSVPWIYSQFYGMVTRAATNTSENREPIGPFPHFCLRTNDICLKQETMLDCFIPGL